MTHGTSEPIYNSETHTKGLLVTRHNFFCLQLHTWMCHVPIGSGLHLPNHSSAHTHTSKDRCFTISNGYCWLHHESTMLYWSVKKNLWCSHDHGRPQYYKRGNALPLHKDQQCHGNCNPIPWRCFQTIWHTILYHLWLQSSIFLQGLSKTGQTLQLQVIYEHSLPLTDWWRNQMNEPGNWSILLHLLWKQAQWMDQLCHWYGICS